MMNLVLANEYRIKVLESKSLFKVMNEILSTEEFENENRRGCFVVSLGIDKEIINIELIALGSQRLLIMEPKEVFGQSISKGASSIMVVLNRVREDLYPYESEMEFIKKVYHCGLLLNIPFLDCLIIRGNKYLSFEKGSLMIEIEKTEELYPAHTIRKRALKEGRRMESIAVARRMLQKELEMELVINSTGLDHAFLQELELYE